MQILDTAAEKSFDDLTRLATYVCKTPMAAITLIDSDRQWFKSRVAIPESETPRDISFCAHAILENRTLIVTDALNDVRFMDNPLVTGEPHVRFYAGSPLTTAAGYRLGTLCILDTVPRELGDGQRAALRALGRQVTVQIELRREINSLRSTIKELESNLGENTQRFDVKSFP
ncbi:MAG: GAF domain-containing protein [Acidobacteriota bacterium]